MKSLLNLVGLSHIPYASKVVPELPDDTSVLLVREPDNPHDPNALQVYVHIGYIKATQAADLSKDMDKMGLDTLDAKIVRNLGHYVELEIDEPEASDAS